MCRRVVEDRAVILGNQEPPPSPPPPATAQPSSGDPPWPQDAAAPENVLLTVYIEQDF